jgi:hypothetical protein
METNQQINIWVLYHILDDETHIWIQQNHYIWFVFMRKKYIEKMKFLDLKIKVNKACIHYTKMHFSSLWVSLDFE